MTSSLIDFIFQKEYNTLYKPRYEEKTMSINIPEKMREDFDRSADFAIEKGEFTPGELALHLGTSTLVSSIMVGYMEKASLVTKGKNDEPRRARITREEWDAIGRRIENYIPAPEVLPEEVEEEEEIPPIAKEELFFLGIARFTFIGETIGFFNNGKKGNYNLSELESVRLKKPFLFFKGTLTLVFKDKTTEKVRFKRAERDMAELLLKRVSR